ncbi:MAG: DUF448 domain-containing protein, partial [bacterium]|nr:DUF448 domain-containing protein [bacterium]
AKSSADVPVRVSIYMQENTRHSPVRMCIGCRERLQQNEIVRLQLTTEGVKILEPWDRPGHGRSVYVCPDPDCFEKALKRGEIAFKRSKYDKISVRLEPRQAERLKYAFAHTARRLRGVIGAGPR